MSYPINFESPSTTKLKELEARVQLLEDSAGLCVPTDQQLYNGDKGFTTGAFRTPEEEKLAELNRRLDRIENKDKPAGFVPIPLAPLSPPMVVDLLHRPKSVEQQIAELDSRVAAMEQTATLGTIKVGVGADMGIGVEMTHNLLSKANLCKAISAASVAAPHEPKAPRPISVPPAAKTNEL